MRAYLGVLAFVTQDVFANSARLADVIAHVVVGRADHVAGIAFLNQLGDGARGKLCDVIRMWLNGRQHLAFVWSTGNRPFDNDAVIRWLRASRPESKAGCAPEHPCEKVAPLHGGILSRTYVPQTPRGGPF